MRLALAQMNSVVGDLDGNRERILERLGGGARRRRRPRALPGARRHRLPARGPAPAPGLRPRGARSVEEHRTRDTGIVALVGAPHLDADLYNACYVLADGEIRGVYRKRFLPNYGVFDEDRYFAPARDLVLLRFGETLVGPTICEDIWQPGPPATELALAGAQLHRQHLGVAVPRRQGPRARGDAARPGARQRLLRRALQRGRRPGRADLRRPLGRDRRRGRADRARARFEEALLVVDLDPVAAVGRRLRDVRRRALARERARASPDAPVIELAGAAPRSSCADPLPAPPLDDLEQMRQALELGLRDYVARTASATS